MAQWNPCGSQGTQGDQLAQHEQQFQHDQLATVSDGHTGYDALWELIRPIKNGIWDRLHRPRPKSSYGLASRGDQNMRQEDLESGNSPDAIHWPSRQSKCYIEDAVLLAQGNKSDPAVDSRTSANATDLFGVGSHLASRQRGLATINERDNEQGHWSFSPPQPPFAQMGNDWPSNHSSPRNAPSHSRHEQTGLNKPTKRSSNGSTVGSITSVAGSVFDTAMSTTSTSFGGESAILNWNEMSSSLPKRQKSSRSPSPSLSNLTSRPIAFDAEGYEIPRTGSPSIVMDNLLSTVLGRGDHDGHTAKTIFSNMETTFYKGGMASPPSREMASLSIGNLKLKESRGQSEKVLEAREESCSKNECKITESHGKLDAGNARDLLAPLTTSISHTSVLGSSADSNSEHDRSFQSPVTQDCYTPATSLQDDNTEEDDLASDDFSDAEDDESFESFAATWLDIDLLPLFLTCWEYVQALVVQSAEKWQSRGGSTQNSGTPSQLHLRPGSTAETGSGRKRALSNDRSSNGDDREDEEDPKRQRTDQQLEHSATLERGFLACPFVKRNPDKTWPSVCWTGFKEVHRIKEHIKRRHMLPPHCDRCFLEFSTDDERTAHRRAEVPCDLADPPDASKGIDADCLLRLKSRKGIQNKPEKEKWDLMYGTVFPGEVIPDPYVDPKKMRPKKGKNGLFQVTQMYIRVIDSRFQGFPEDFRSFLKNEIQDGLHSEIQEGLYSTPQQPSASSTVSGMTQLHNGTFERSEPSGGKAESTAPVQPRPEPSIMAVANDEDGKELESDIDGSFCPHVEGRIPFPNPSCQMCRVNAEYGEMWQPDPIVW